MNNKHQTTDPGSLENTKWDKYPSLKKKKKGKENHTEAHQVQMTENP